MTWTLEGEFLCLLWKQGAARKIAGCGDMERALVTLTQILFGTNPSQTGQEVACCSLRLPAAKGRREAAKEQAA